MFLRKWRVCLEMDEQAIIEDFRERAAIMEFCAGLPRINAESMALRDIVARMGQEAGRVVQRWRNSND
jgi:hypothetical protein